MICCTFLSTPLLYSNRKTLCNIEVSNKCLFHTKSVRFSHISHLEDRMTGVSILLFLLYCTIAFCGEGGWLKVIMTCRFDSNSCRAYKRRHIAEAEANAKYFFSVVSDNRFQLYIDQTSIHQQPYIAIIAKSIVNNHYGYLNYKVDQENFICDSIPLSIEEVKDLGDSCAELTIRYDGSGDIYFLQREDGIDVPRVGNILSEGVYVGKYAGSNYQMRWIYL